MARFILDVASENGTLTDKQYNEIVDNFYKSFKGEIATLVLIDKTNNCQFHEDLNKNRLSKTQIKNYEKELKRLVA